VLQDRAHAIQVDTLKLAQARERFRERQAQIDDNLAEMAAEEESERERLFLADEAIDAQREQLGNCRRSWTLRRRCSNRPNKHCATNVSRSTAPNGICASRVLAARGSQQAAGTCRRPRPGAQQLERIAKS
jgi:hypothetical protein